MQVLPPLIDKIKDINNYPLDQCLAVIEKSNISSRPLAALSHVLYGLLLREKYYIVATKRKGLILRGKPYTGKTRITTILKEFFRVADS